MNTYQENDIPMIMDVAEAADILRVGKSAVYALIRSRQLVGLRIGRKLRVTRDALLQFINTSAS